MFLCKTKWAKHVTGESTLANKFKLLQIALYCLTFYVFLILNWSYNFIFNSSHLTLIVYATQPPAVRFLCYFFNIASERMLNVTGGHMNNCASRFAWTTVTIKSPHNFLPVHDPFSFCIDCLRYDSFNMCFSDCGYGSGLCARLLNLIFWCNKHCALCTELSSLKTVLALYMKFRLHV